MSYQVATFYKFFQLDDPEAEVARHKEFFSNTSMAGRIYFSTAGVNAQFSGLVEDVSSYLSWLGQDMRYQDLMVKLQTHHENVFPRMTVKVRPELVALGRPVDLVKRATPVSPKEWRAMLESGEQFIRLDVRNDYEWEVGHFEGFERPPGETFRDFLNQAEELSATHDGKTAKVMMCCTGGIRCEIYGALLREKGFEEVYQLDGGILNYAEEEGGEHFEGKLFVFDDRLAIDVGSREPIGTCHCCSVPSETYYNCANMDCNKLFLSCEQCLEERGGCCTDECRRGPRVRPFDHQKGGKPFRKWYTYFSEEQRQRR